MLHERIFLDQQIEHVGLEDLKKITLEFSKVKHLKCNMMVMMGLRIYHAILKNTS